MSELSTARDHVWIVTRYQSACVECGDDLPVGSHILWLPGAPRDKNNYCAPCGTEVAGSYPPQNYWDRRENDFHSPPASKPSQKEPNAV